MTLSDLQNLVSFGLDDLNFGYFTTAQVNSWINNAHREVQKRLIRCGQNYYVKRVQTTMVPNQRDYIIPSDMKKVHRLEIIVSGTAPNESVQPLTPITWNQQDLVIPGVGTPTCYSLLRQRFILHPYPDTPLTLRLSYSYLVTDLVNATDVPDCQSEYHELLALLAMQDGFIKDGRVPEILLAKIATYEKDMDSDAQERRQDLSREVRELGDSSSGGGFYF